MISTLKYLRVFVFVSLVFFSGALMLSSAFVRADQPITIGRILGSGMAIDNAGNIALTGSTASFGQGGSIAYLFKFDPTGKRLCFLTWGPQDYNTQPNGGTGSGAGSDTFGYGVAFDSSNNMYWTGTTMAENHETYDVFLIKYDSSCNQVYEVGWGGAGNDIGRGVAVDASDNVYVTGSTGSFGSGQGFVTSDIFLLKYGPSGESQWSRTWGGLQNDYGTGVTVDSVGNVYVVGSTESYGPQSQFVLLKYDPYGNLLYQKVWGGPQANYGTGVAVDSGDNVYMTGYTYSYGSTPGVASAVLVKYDPSGNQLFAQTWGGKGNTFGYGVTVDAAGDAYVTGYMYGSHPNSDVATTFLLKYDPSGNLQSEQTWGGNRGDYAYAVDVDNVGNVFVTGYTYSFGSNTNKGADFFLLKYDAFGNLIYQLTYGGGVPLTYNSGASVVTPEPVPEFDGYFAVVAAICALGASFCLRLRKR
ncbi:MAG: SBBP repeat-containing protein [Candidatus Bathyarchaeia archaeon]